MRPTVITANKDGELLSRVVKAHGTQMYVPQQDVKMIGAGQSSPKAESSSSAR